MKGCNTCNSAQSTLLWRVNDFDIYRCGVCQLVYADVQKDDVQNIYEQDYYQKVYPDYETDIDIHNRNNELYLTEIHKYCKTGDLLEIGCAFGFFLKKAKDLGWNASGYETSEYASRIARQKYGVDVKHTNFLLDNISSKYDCICFFDSIEHLLDPNAFVEKGSKLLKPSGCIMITTGNIESLHAKILGKKWRMILPPLHVYYYSPSSLSACLKKHGFEVLSVSHQSRYQNFGSILQFLSGISKNRLPFFPLKINLGDIMTVIGKKQ